MANDVSVVWARFCHRRSTQPSQSLLNTNGTYIDNKTLVSIKKRKKEKYLWPSEARAHMWMEMHLIFLYIYIIVAIAVFNNKFNNLHFWTRVPSGQASGMRQGRAWGSGSSFGRPWPSNTRPCPALHNTTHVAIVFLCPLPSSPRC